MNNSEDILQNLRSVASLYRSYTHSAAKEFSLTDAEADVLVFLHTHPRHNTATDITEICHMTKSNVSQAVDRLMSVGLLNRERDSADRRKVHLFPTDTAAPILAAILKARKSFEEQLVKGFSQKEMDMYMDFNSRIAKNAVEALNKEQSNNNTLPG